MSDDALPSAAYSQYVLRVPEMAPTNRIQLDIRRPACGIEWRSAGPSHPVCAWLIGQLPIVRSIRAGSGRGRPPRRDHGSAWSWPQRDHPTSSYGWDSHARDLLEIAEHYGADSFDMTGHSMGGFIGRPLAAQYPRRCSRLVLIDLIDAVASLSPALYRPSPKSVSRLGPTYPSTAAVLSYMRAAGTIAPWNEFWDRYFAWRAGTGRRHRPDSDRLGCGERRCRLRIDARPDHEGSDEYPPIEKAPGSYVRAT